MSDENVYVEAKRVKNDPRLKMFAKGRSAYARARKLTKFANASAKRPKFIDTIGDLERKWMLEEDSNFLETHGQGFLTQETK